MQRWFALVLLPLLSVPVGAGERLRAYVGTQGVTGTFVESGPDAIKTVKDMQKRLSKKFTLVPSLPEADFGVIVLGRGRGEIRQASQLGFSAEDDKRPGQAGWTASSVKAWIAVDIISLLPSKQRIVSTSGGWDACADDIARSVRQWSEANGAKLIEARSTPKPGRQPGP